MNTSPAKFAIQSRHDTQVFVTGWNPIEPDGLNWAHTDDIETMDVILTFDTEVEADEFNDNYNQVGLVVRITA